MKLRKMIDHLNTVVLTLKSDYEIMKAELAMIKKKDKLIDRSFKSIETQVTKHLNSLDNKLHKENVVKFFKKEGVSISYKTDQESGDKITIFNWR